MRAVRGLASFRRFFGPRRGGGNGGGGVTSDRKDGPIGEMSDDEASAARKKPEALVCDIEEEMENECCICLIDMEERKFRGKMDCCDHVVCWCCIQEWSQTSRSCPICQRVYNKCKKVEHKCKKKRHTKPGQGGDKGKRQPSLWEKVGGRLMRRRFGSARTSPTPSTAGAQSWSDAEGDDGANLHLQEVVIVGRPVPDDRASSDGGHSSNRSSRSSHSSRSSSGSSNRDNNSSRAEDGDDLLRAHLHVDVIDNHHVPAEADGNDGDDNNIINVDADNDVGQLVDVDLADVDDNDGEAAAPVTVETVESPVAETEVAFADQTSERTSVASSASLSSSSSLLSSALSSFSCSTTSSSSSSSATGDEEAESSQTTSTTSTTTSTTSTTSSSSSSRLNTKGSLFSAQEVKEEEEENDECPDEASVIDHNSDDVDQKGKGKERETASLLEEDEAKDSDSDSDSSDDEEDEEEDEDEDEEDDADYDDNGPLFGRMPEDNGY